MIPALLLAADLTVSIGGMALRVPASAQSGTASLPVSVVVTGEPRVVLGALLHRGWSLNLHTARAGEPLFTLAGRAPDLEFEHAGSRIDERYKLMLWRRPEKRRGLPVWVAAVGAVSGVQPLERVTAPASPSTAARDRLVADFSFGLAQAKRAKGLVWVEAAAAPEGAEELIPDERGAAGSAALSAVGRGVDLKLAPAEAQKTTVAGVQKLQPLPPPKAVLAAAIYRPERAGDRVALTFDACSTLDRSFYDERVMTVLRETKTPATLFISGRWAESHQEIVRALAADPLFEIANHSYIHPHMTEMPLERQEHELLWTQQILFTLTGKVPRFFRPPYGEMNDELVRVAARVGLRTVEYDYPSGDPDKAVTRERMVKWVVGKARPGSIVVMHMNRNGWHTAEALPEIVAGLRKRGFRLSTVGDVVDADAAGAK